MSPIPPIEGRLYRQPWPGEYRFFQLGFVVGDLRQAAERWTRVFGVGPFHVVPRSPTTATYRGRVAVLDVEVAVAQAGPVQIELIQDHSPVESIFSGFDDRRIGFHQLCTVTHDFAGTTAHYERLGYEVACELVHRDQRVAFFDTVDDFGFYTEVAEATPEFLDALATISETCAAWDGMDPYRVLTRNGYRVP